MTELPHGWKRVSIGDIAHVKRGASPRPIRDPRWFGGDVGWVRIADVTSSHVYLRKTTDYLSPSGVAKSVRVYPGEVILSIAATVGEVAIIDMAACIHDGFVALKNLASDVDTRYLYYVLLFNQPTFKKAGQHGSQANINSTIVEDTALYLPPLAEQRKIAEILSTWDEAIALTEQLIDALERRKKGLMQRLLTGAVRFPEIEGSEWRVARLPDILLDEPGAIKVGPFGSQLKKSEMVPEGYKVYGQENVYESDFGLGDRYVTAEKFNALSSCEVKPGDFLITMMGTIGKCATVPEGIAPGIMDSHLMRLRVDPTIYYQPFLAYVFRSFDAIKQISRLSVGGIMDGLSSKIVQELHLPLPSLEEQVRISAVLTQADIEIGSYLRYVGLLKAQKKGLMQRVLTGQVRVKV